MNFRAWLRTVALATGCLLLVGCSPKYAFVYSSGDTLNTDPATGSSRPVRVLVFLLTDVRNFEDASDEELWNGGNDDVKKDIVGDPYVIDVIPGHTDSLELELGDEGTVDDSVKYVGVFAQYVASDPPPQRRGTFRLKGFEHVTFHFEGTRIVATGVKKDE